MSENTRNVLSLSSIGTRPPSLCPIDTPAFAGLAIKQTKSTHESTENSLPNPPETRPARNSSRRRTGLCSRKQNSSSSLVTRRSLFGVSRFGEQTKRPLTLYSTLLADVPRSTYPHSPTSLCFPPSLRRSFTFDSRPPTEVRPPTHSPRERVPRTDEMYSLRRASSPTGRNRKQTKRTLSLPHTERQGITDSGGVDSPTRTDETHSQTSRTFDGVAPRFLAPPEVGPGGFEPYPDVLVICRARLAGFESV